MCNDHATKQYQLYLNPLWWISQSVLTLWGPAGNAELINVFCWFKGRIREHAEPGGETTVSPPPVWKIWEIELYFEFEAHILQDFYMDDFQSFGGYFPSKPDFTPPYPPISGHSVIAPSKFSLHTVSLCIDRRYWSFGYCLSWLVGIVCGKMMDGCINTFPACLRTYLNTLWIWWFTEWYSQ